MTYGEAKRRLQSEHRFGDIFPTMMGHPAGAAMDNLHDADPTAPLINVLLVKEENRLPGAGVRYYLADRFRKPQLREEQADKKYPDLWRKISEKAMDEVYAYRDWEKLFKRIYGQAYAPDPETVKRQKGRDGREKDGLPRGRSGEGKNHEALRLWVKDNPQKIIGTKAGIVSKTEVELLSGDRVDVVYYGRNKTFAIEVKSRDSNWYDLRRGIYQCVKYDAVLFAQDPRSDPAIEPILVTEEKLDGDLQKLAKRLGIKSVTVPHNRKG
ncbi:MAG: hypothetical protein RID59_19590 [Hoeflea sp.]